MQSTASSKEKMAKLATNINTTAEVDSSEEELNRMEREINDLRMHMERIDQNIQSSYSFLHNLLTELNDLKILVTQMVSNHKSTRTVSEGRSTIFSPNSHAYGALGTVDQQLGIYPSPTGAAVAGKPAQP